MKFYNLLTEQQLANRCFYVTNRLTSAVGIVYEERLDFVSTLKKNFYQRIKGAFVRTYNRC